jgi:uncharacterized RDD family membrane protein YckC
MKCPKCDYIGFGEAIRCRNCGYDFSLAVPRQPEDEGRSGPDDPVAAPEDLEIRFDVGARGSRRKTVPFTPSDLDLLFPSPASGDLPLFEDAPADVPVARPPLSVRRSTPPAPRMRPRTVLRRQPAVAELELEPEADPKEPVPRPAIAEATLAPAGPGARAMAGVLDLVILLGLDAGVVYFTLRLCLLAFSEIALLPVAPIAAFLVLLDSGYLIAFTAMGGQTIGKMAARIKVVDDGGGPVVFSQAVVRTVAYLASIVPVGLGFIPVLFGQGRRALHDRLTNTRVVNASS